MTFTVPDIFSIQIKMTSDWHVGSGAGRGEIDSAVQRDQDGLPYIPAKTLTGILRDGCEQVALALDNGNQRGQWHNWINFLFGDQPAILDPERNPEDQEKLETEPHPAIVSIQSAYFEAKLRDALSTKKQLASAIAFIKPGVAIDEKTGSAKPDFLRFEEVVRMNAMLTAQICKLDFSEIPNVDDNQKRIAYALLIAGAQIVDRLGGKRRRGNGTCTITLNAENKNIESKKWLEWLEKNYKTAGEPPEWEQSKLPDTTEANPKADTTWYTIPLSIKTLSPIVLPKRTVGNVVESLDYIPGRYLLRHVHRALGNNLNVSQAIACGDLVITNATIEIEGKSGRPTPFCLFSEKLNGGLSKGRGVYNRFQESEPDIVQLKGERSGYIGEFNQVHLPTHKTTSLEVLTHNTIRDDVQRPTSDVGGIYSYEAIPAKTTLIAELRLPNSIYQHLLSKSKKWWDDLKGTVKIGQSKKDQYGTIEITVGQPYPVEPSSNSSQSHELYIWFLSDVLLRNQRLAPTTHPDDLRNYLQSTLGVVLEERSEPNDQLSLMLKQRRTESWQVRWGLPRPSMLGWQAGSCVVYQVLGEVKPEKLTELEAKGIGDRCAEGYGQICFNNSLIMAKLSDKERPEYKSEPKRETVKPISPSEASFNYARIVETAAWREMITNRAIAIATDKEERKKILGLKIVGKESVPTMSQLGSVRSNLRKLKSKSDISSISTWVESLKQNRADRWEKTQNGLKQLSDLVTQEQTVWRYLESNVTSINLEKLDWEQLTITKDGVRQLKQDLWAEAVRILVDAIIRAHKRDLEKTQEAA
jgi:CRISPR-associated protein Csx10